MRHLYANFRKRFSGKKLKILTWKAAKSTHPAVWERVMLTIKELNIHAFKYLITIPLQSNDEMTSISCFPANPKKFP